MGASTSKNTVENCIRSQLSVVNSSSSGIYTTLSNTSNLTVCANNGSSVTIGSIDISQFGKFNGSATLTAISDANVIQSMQQEADQQAKAIQQQFAFGTEADAENIAKLTSELSTEVRNSIKQVISTSISNIANISLCASGSSSVTVTGALTVNQGLDLFSQYVISSCMTTSASVQLQQTLKQSATAEIQSFLGPLALILVAVVVIGGIAVITMRPKDGGGSGGSAPPEDPRKTIAKKAALYGIPIIIFIIVYFSLAFKYKWFPFHKKTT